MNSKEILDLIKKQTGMVGNAIEEAILEYLKNRRTGELFKRTIPDVITHAELLTGASQYDIKKMMSHLVASGQLVFDGNCIKLNSKYLNIFCTEKQGKYKM